MYCLHCCSFSYNQSFDLEGESGIVVRGIGTCVLLIPAHQSPTTLQAPPTVQLPPGFGGNFDITGTGTGGGPEELMMVDPMGGLFSPHHHHAHPLQRPGSLRRKTSSSSSDEVGQPPSPTKLVAGEAGTSSGSGGLHAAAMSPLKPIISTSVSAV